MRTRPVCRPRGSRAVRRARPRPARRSGAPRGWASTRAATSASARRAGDPGATSRSVCASSSAVSIAALSSGTRTASVTPAYRARACATASAGLRARDRRADPVDQHHARRAEPELGELGQPADQPLDAHRVARADHHDDVGRLERAEGGRVAPRRPGVVAEHLVLLQAEAAVDDRPLREPARDRPHGVERRRRQLGPTVGARDPGQHPQVGRDRRASAARGSSRRACPAPPRGRRPRARAPRRAARAPARRSRRRCRRRPAGSGDRPRRAPRRGSPRRSCGPARPWVPRRRRRGPGWAAGR